MSSAAAHWSPAVTELVQSVRTRFRGNGFLGTKKRFQHEPTSGRSTPYESGQLIRVFRDIGRIFHRYARFIDGSVS